MKSLINFTKRLMAIVMLTATTISSYASAPYESYSKGHFALDLSLGSNIDLSSLSQEQKAVFDERPLSVFQISMRPSYYFSRHWGAYADLRINFFRFSDTERLIDVLAPGLSKLKPAIGLGATYRYEKDRWQIQPRLGVGIVEYGSRTSKKNTNNTEIEQKLSGSMWCVDAGVSAAYRTSRVCSIFLDVSAMQPFTPAKYCRTTTVDGATSVYNVDSYSWGRSMSLSLGIRFQTSNK